MKTILLTGATDGIGWELTKMIAKENCNLLLHGRSREKLNSIAEKLQNSKANIHTFVADFTDLYAVINMSQEILANFQRIDVLINNAGIFVTKNSKTINGIDIRFSVNTIAPYILTRRLFPILDGSCRVINLASAAQEAIDFDALKGVNSISQNSAYAQSKLALIMWSMEMAKNYPQGPAVIAVNPKSFLGSKMVKEAYGQVGYDLKIGANILYKAAFSHEFENGNGQYFDNDYGIFTQPHSFALNRNNRLKLMQILDLFYQL